MHYISTVAAVAALASIATAGNAPVVNGNKIGVTYVATLPPQDSGALSGSVKISAAPNGEGVNVLVSLYNLPSNVGNMSYGIYTGKVGADNDCSAAGAILNPYGGVTGSQCAKNMASCEIGDLSDKHGPIVITSGGSGTGAFPANYEDEYLSMTPGSEAFFGKGSLVITEASGTVVSCANFVNPVAQASSISAAKAAHHTKTMMSSSTSSAAGSSTSSSAGGKATAQSSTSSTSSGGAAGRTAAPMIGAGFVGLAALLI